VRASGLGARLLVMGALTPDDLRVALACGADVVAWTRGFVEAVAAARSAASVHVKFDSGMGRLGTRDAREAQALCDAVAAEEGVELAGLMTHLATADELEDDYFQSQLERFGALVEAVPRGSTRTSSATRRTAPRRCATPLPLDLVRCGVAGLRARPVPARPREHGLEPALMLESYVAQVSRLSRAESAGYGRTWRAREPTLVACCHCAYGRRQAAPLSNNAEVLIQWPPTSARRNGQHGQRHGRTSDLTATSSSARGLPDRAGRRCERILAALFARGRRCPGAPRGPPRRARRSAPVDSESSRLRARRLSRGGHQPGELHPLLGGGPHRTELVPRAPSLVPSRPMPLSNLTWTLAADRAAATASTNPRVQATTSAPQARATRRSSGVSAPITSSRAPSPDARKRRRLRCGRHGKPARAAGERGAGALEGTVTVAVRLDDGAQLSAGVACAQQPAVSLDRAEVDFRASAFDADRRAPQAALSRPPPESFLSITAGHDDDPRRSESRVVSRHASRRTPAAARR